MDKFSYVSGVVLFFLSLIIRLAFTKMLNLTKLRNWTVEEKSAYADITLLGLTGILMIILGAVQNLFKDWLELSIWGFIVQFFLTFAPILSFWTISWFKYKGHSSR